MGTLSDKTRAFLNRILRGAKPTTAEAAAMALEASILKQPRVVGHLLHLLGHDRDTSRVAVSSIEDLIRATPPMRFLQLDQSLRERSEYNWPMLRTWPAVLPVRLSAHTLKDFAQGSTACLGALASHPDGHVREAAVRALADVRTGTELPFLLIRLNDWVRQVRDFVNAAVIARLTDDYVAHFVRFLPLVVHLKDQQRADHAVQHYIQTLLHRPESRPALMGAISSGDHQSARLAFQLLRNAPGAPLQDLLDRGLQSRDPVLRLRAAQLAHERLEGDGLRATLRRLSSDKFMPVRRQALYAFHEKLSDEATEQLHRALFDPHAAVRDTARFLLRQRGDTPSASIYRERLAAADPRQLPTLIAALGEVGDAADVHVIRLYLDNPLAPVRAAAVGACARLDGDALAEQFLRLLRDDRSAKVSRTARDALLPRRHLVGFERIWAVVEGAAWPHARYHALTLLADRDWWTSIEYFLRAVVLDDEALRALALRFIGRRRHEGGRFARRPSDAQMRSIASALDAAVSYVDRAFVEDVRYGMEYVRSNFAPTS